MVSFLGREKKFLHTYHIKNVEYSYQLYVFFFFFLNHDNSRSKCD